MIDKAKNIISVCKDLLILSLVLLLLIFPATFNGVMGRAGFTELSVGGLTWKEKAIATRQVADSSEQLLAAAAAHIEQMQAHLDSVSKQLAALSAATNSPGAHAIAASLDSSRRRFAFYNIELKKNVLTQNRKLNEIFIPRQ